VKYKTGGSFGLKGSWLSALERDVLKYFQFMDKILLISPNSQLVRGLKWKLEDAGFLVSVSNSLEESFLETAAAVPFLVIVDDDATPDETWHTRKFLRWFHRRSPVLLLSNGGCEGMEEECDHCLTKQEYKEELISYIQDWVVQTKKSGNSEPPSDSSTTTE
jgi:DNA-binding response OmpR family regulator